MSMEMSMATASQLRHIVMKILPAPEMVAQGKAFRISNHLEMIRDSLWAINSFLMDAALRALEQPDVAEWMKDVGVAVEDVHCLLKRILDYWEPNEEDETEKKMKMSNFLQPLVNNNIQSTSNRRSILVELKETACLLNYLVKRGTVFGLWVEMMDSMDPNHDDYAAIINEEVIGRDEEEGRIVDCLQLKHCDEHGNLPPFIAAIRGPPSIGKTTLARKIYHHPWVRQHFQHRIWLDASSFRHFNSSMIGKEIARLLTRKPCTNVDCWPLINEHLGGDRCLLILDDVNVSEVLKFRWEELKLNLLHCGAPGSRVILAGRTFKQRYEISFHGKVYDLKELPEDALIRLLLRYATFVHPIEGNNNIHKEKASPAATDMLIPLAEKCRQDYCAIKCPRLPKCMGLMFRRRDKSQWQELANQLYKFDHLPHEFNFFSIDGTRSSLYMLLFEGSSDESYRREDVLHMLVAEGTLTNTRLEINSEYIPSKFNLDICFFRLKVGENSNIPPQCRHLSLFIDFKNILKSKKAIEKAGVANKLRSLALHRGEKKEPISQKETKILEGMFLNLQRLGTLHMRAIMIQDLPSSVGTLHSLRYLNLAENKIETLPESIYNLGNLCVLNLSSCKKLEELPRQIHKLRKLQVLKLSCCLRIQKLLESITRLVNLKELDVGGCCWLSKLPDDLSNLKNLMQLNMHGCASLTRMPSGIRQLTNLEVLWGYDAIDGLGNVMVSELQGLTNLESLHIQHLERLVSVEAEEKDITPTTSLLENQHVNELMLHWEWWNDMVAEGTFEPALQLAESFQRNLRELKVLRIVSYMSNKLPSWLIKERSISILKTLTTVHLVNLRRCERLPPLGHLPWLKEVAISGFDSVRVIDDDFYRKAGPIVAFDEYFLSGVFPQLNRLTFSEMPRLQKWDSYLKKKPYEYEIWESPFPVLTELTLIQCPKLRELHVHFPRLVSLKLWLGNEMLMPTSKFNDWETFGEMNMLQIFGCQELRSLPDGLRIIPNLQTLMIMNCNKLEALPIWLEPKLSLENLFIYDCPALSSIPEGLKVKGRLRNLIVEACPKLQNQKYTEYEGRMEWNLFHDQPDWEENW